VGLLDTKPEEPRSKRLLFAVGGVALVLLAGFLVWLLVLRFRTETGTVERFLNAVVAKNFQQGYRIWNPNGTSYTYQDFLGDFGTQGYYGPIESYHIVSATAPSNSNAVAIVAEVSPYRPFPAQADPKSGRDKQITLWVDRINHALSFPP
jgi:hypothetical protein